MISCGPSQTTINPSIPPTTPASQGLHSIVQVTPVRPARKLAPIPRTKPATMPIMRIMFFFMIYTTGPMMRILYAYAYRLCTTMVLKRSKTYGRPGRTSAVLASCTQNVMKPLPHFIRHLVFLASDYFSRQLNGQFK